MRYLARAYLLALSLMAIFGLTSCASLAPEGPRSYTTALQNPDASAPLNRISRVSLEGASPGESGVRLVLGPSGLDARLALLRNARQTLDLQYYHLHNDVTGRLMLRELRDAAQRGVRVRLLLDDLYTDEIEALLGELGAYPNIEVRLFNPFPTRGSVRYRFAAALLDVARLNRRMHNKLFVADGVLAITGGRNLGDEYFMRSSQSNYFDYDALVAGPVVTQMGSLFDVYWNSEQVRGARGLLRPAGTPEALRRNFSLRVEGPDTPEPIRFLGLDRMGRASVAEELAAGRVAMVFGIAQAFADSPAKAWGELEYGRLPSGALLDSPRLLLTNEFRAARKEIRVSSPYFVPGQETLTNARNNVLRGVSVSLLTNSLASTDEPVVHTGYRRYRDNLLRAGVKIFELQPRLGQTLLLPGEVSTASLRLHTKAAVIDSEKMFIGSLNFDPRSQALNTEFGLFVHSSELAEQANLLFELLQREASYEVRLKDAEGRNLEWVRLENGAAVEVIDTEPGTDLWTRMKLYFQSIVIPESLL